MMRLETIILRFSNLEKAELISWIERGWIRPEPVELDDWVFQDIDIARIQLVFDLRRDMGVSEDTIPLILSLMDQVYELRAHLKAHLKAVTRAFETQPPEVRAALLAAMAFDPKLDDAPKAL
jgi:chaperone modulatory protein CbpM